MKKLIFAIAVAVVFALLSMWWTKTIYESSLPEWLKLWLLMPNK